MLKTLIEAHIMFLFFKRNEKMYLKKQPYEQKMFYRFCNCVFVLQKPPIHPEVHGNILIV